MIDPHRQCKVVLLVVAEDCNLACRYCYVCQPGARRRMPDSVVRAAVDYVLGHRELFPEPNASWVFFGGEPLLEAELIADTIDYIRHRAAQLSHPWAERSHFAVPTNGTLYATAAAQELVRRAGRELEVRFTIDGLPRVHDQQRVFADGRGSYEAVVANVPLWLEQIQDPMSYLTVTPQSLPHLAESILHLFDLGIRRVRAKTVYEDVWQSGDGVVFEQQLDALAAAMLQRRIWRTHECFLLRPDVAERSTIDVPRLWCGAGQILAVGADGAFYPCQRFLEYTLARRPARSIGNLADGLDLNRLRPFVARDRAAECPAQCIACDAVATCDTCMGHDYDHAATPTVFQRSTHICAMHRARVRANRRFWAEVRAREGSAPG